MKAASKFLRSIEKSKNWNTDSDVTSSESSNMFTPQKLSRENSSRDSTSSSSLLNNPRKGSKEDTCLVPLARQHPENKLEVANKKGLEQIESPLSEPQLSRSSSASSKLNSSDLQLKQEFLERYLSEGEVLSQGEIQLGLSDDDVQDF